MHDAGSVAHFLVALEEFTSFHRQRSQIIGEAQAAQSAVYMTDAMIMSNDLPLFRVVPARGSNAEAGQRCRR